MESSVKVERCQSQTSWEQSLSLWNSQTAETRQLTLNRIICMKNEQAYSLLRVKHCRLCSVSSSNQQREAEKCADRCRYVEIMCWWLCRDERFSGDDLWFHFSSLSLRYTLQLHFGLPKPYRWHVRRLCSVKNIDVQHEKRSHSFYDSLVILFFILLLFGE